jgi:hypothetical protein
MEHRPGVVHNMITEAETSTDMDPGIATHVRRRPAILEKQAGSALSVAELLTRNEAPRVAVMLTRFDRSRIRP